MIMRGVYLRGKNWYIDYYAHGRRRREKVGPSRKLAETVLQKRRVEVAEGRFLDIRKDQKIRFEDFADEYLELHCKSNNKSWLKSDYFNLENLKKFFPGKYLHEITPQDIEQYKSERIKEVTKSTINRALAVLKSLFNKAIEWGKAETNPCRAVKLFKEDNKRLCFLEKEEINKLLSNCCDHLRPIVIVALNTGMRKSEILGLKWHDIDIKRNIIHLYDTKNGEKREIPMNEVVQKTIIGVLKDSESQYIFCNKYGKPYRQVRTSFFTACTKSGIVNFRFHDLRHTFASQLVMSGIDLNTVRELLGHKSLKMTLRYAHLSPDHKKRAVDILGKNLVTGWSQEQISGKGQEIKNSQLPENKLIV